MGLYSHPLLKVSTCALINIHRGILGTIKHQIDNLMY